MMWRNTWSSVHPSTTAASESSRGMVRKNCRSRKMLKAEPNQAGIQSGRKVPIHPRCRKSENIGTMRTGKGIIMVARVTPKNTSLPGHLSRAKP